MRRFVICVWVGVLAASGAAHAQADDETLADIRQQLSVLYVEVQKLKRELSTTGGVGEVAVGGSVIERTAAIESELQRLISKTEELEFRIDRIVQDGGNRLNDLEFRLCELESGCDIATLGQGTTLGGGAFIDGSTGAATASDAASDAAGAELAVGERADFDRAAAALAEGDHATAAELFARFQQTYPGSPLGAEAGLRRGEALEQAGEATAAARAYLDTFSTAPNGPEAPEALFRLGRALGRLGQTDEACVTLAEVGLRFPGGGPAQNAEAEMLALGCS